MGIERKTELDKDTGLEAKINTGIISAWKQLNWRGKFISYFGLAISTYLAGPLTTFVTWGTNLIVHRAVQKKRGAAVTPKSLLAETLFSTIMAPYMVAGYTLFNKLESMLAKMAVGFGAMVPASFGMYFSSRYLLHNYTFREFAQRPAAAFKESYGFLKENFWKAYKKSLIWLPVPLGLYWNYTHHLPIEVQASAHTCIGTTGRIMFRYNIDKDVEYRKGIRPTGVSGNNSDQF